MPNDALNWAYDLHLHSGLSPCGEDEMTPNNIANMAMLKGLNLIALCDHNTTRQCEALVTCCQQVGIECWYGVEVTTQEEVHVCGYFNFKQHADSFEQWLNEHRIAIPNDAHYFGHQLLRDCHDEVIAEEENSLLFALDADLQQTVEAIQDHHGFVSFPHLFKSNGIIHQLGFIPESCEFSALEARNEEEKQQCLQLHPWLSKRKFVWLNNSDAHQLVDLHEAEHFLTNQEVLWLKEQMSL